ncbi:MAG TPA: MFS transporter, partial [Ilumatobacteraceae bacterium]
MATPSAELRNAASSDAANRLGRRFWTLATSSGLSNLADGAFKLALPLVAIRFTRSPGLVAGIELVRSLPWLLFALPAGAFVDRWDRRHTMLVANTVRATILLVPAVALAMDGGSLLLLFVAAAVTGVAEVFYDTSAQSILPSLVPAERLSRANGRLYAVELGAQQFVGPPLAGVIVGVALAAAFWVPSAMWVAALAVLFTLRGNFRPARSGATRTIRSDIAEGVRFVGHHRLLRTMAVMVGGINLATSATFAVFVLYAVGDDSTLALTDTGFGLVMLASAAGSIVGSFVCERIERAIGRAHTLTLSILGMAVMVGVAAVTSNVWIVVAGMVLGGFAVMLWNIPTVSFRQHVTPDHLLGRVNSTYRLLAWGTMPLGALLGGLVGQAFGLTAVFVVGAALVLALLVPNLVITDERLAAA